MIAISAQIFCLAPVLLYWTISSESLYSKQSTLTEPLILINNIILPSSSSILNLPLSTKLQDAYHRYMWVQKMTSYYRHRRTPSLLRHTLLRFHMTSEYNQSRALKNIDTVITS